MQDKILGKRGRVSRLKYFRKWVCVKIATVSRICISKDQIIIMVENDHIGQYTKRRKRRRRREET